MALHIQPYAARLPLSASRLWPLRRPQRASFNLSRFTVPEMFAVGLSVCVLLDHRHTCYLSKSNRPFLTTLLCIDLCVLAYSCILAIAHVPADSPTWSPVAECRCSSALCNTLPHAQAIRSHPAHMTKGHGTSHHEHILDAIAVCTLSAQARALPCGRQTRDKHFAFAWHRVCP